MPEEEYCLASLVLFPNSMPWTPAFLQAPSWAPRPYPPPLISLSTMECGGQLDVSQHKASTVLGLTKSLDGPLDLAAPEVALWAFLGTIPCLCRRSWSKPASLALCRTLCFCFIQVPHGSYCPS